MGDDGETNKRNNKLLGLMEVIHDEEVMDVTAMSNSDEKQPLIRKKQEKKVLSLDEALDSPGVGLFHILLILVAGWALASDSVEVQCISFVTPQLTDKDANPDSSLRPTNFEKGLLDAVIFVGMMVGGYFWGSWSDVVGRRVCLITSLTFNGLFGLASAFSPTYIWFLFFRFMSGVGVGGSLPVAFSYFCEFFSRRMRGPFVIVLAGFWIIGSVFASLLALAIIEPLRYDLTGRLGGIHLTSWRVYIMLCTFPALSAALLLLLFPESPSFLFTKGKVQRTYSALKRIRTVNKWSPCCMFHRPTQDPIECEDLDFISSESYSKDDGTFRKIASICNASVELFSLTYLRATVVLCIIWFTLSFGYYGLLLWFPEYFKRIQEAELNTTVLTNNNSIYLDSVYTSLASIPGTILGIITVNLLGGKFMLTSSMCLSAVSVFLIRIVPARERNIVILSCIFNGIAIFGWNALDIISTSEIFPVHLRSTAFGIQALFGRTGAILGNLAFGRLIGVDPMVPILMVAVLLLVGGLSGIILPSPPGENIYQNLKNFKRKLKLCLCWPIQRIIN